MIREMSIVTLALVVGLACSTSDLCAQETQPEPAPRAKMKVKRRPPGAVTKVELHRAHRVDAHVKKMLALAMELREGGFEEEADVLIHQAKRLAGKKRKPDTGSGLFPRPTLERIFKQKREAEKRARAHPEVIELEVVEEERARDHLDVVRTRERNRARAEHGRARMEYERARRKKAAMARPESDLDRRVEHLSKQVQELRHMIQDLKRALNKSDARDKHERSEDHDKYRRRGPRAR